MISSPARQVLASARLRANVNVVMLGPKTTESASSQPSRSRPRPDARSPRVRRLPGSWRTTAIVGIAICQAIRDRGYHGGRHLTAGRSIEKDRLPPGNLPPEPWKMTATCQGVEFHGFYRLSPALQWNVELNPELGII